MIEEEEEEKEETKLPNRAFELSPHSFKMRCVRHSLELMGFVQE